MRENFEPTVWGPHAWFFLESVAMAYPIKPSYQEKKAADDFFNFGRGSDTGKSKSKKGKKRKTKRNKKDEEETKDGSPKRKKKRKYTMKLPKFRF